MQHALEAYDLIRFAQQLAQRLVAARDLLEEKEGGEAEKQWLRSAAGLLEARTRGLGPLTVRARRLPELGVVREECAGEVVAAWVDALEKLLAGITFHAGPRSPVIEALFPHQKFPQLRRATFDVAEQYMAELERRLRSSYIERMFGDASFTFAPPVVTEVRQGFERVKETLTEPDTGREEAQAIHQELLAAAEGLEQVVTQCKLVAEAALLPFPELYEEQGLSAKPKKRAPRASAPPAEAEEARHS